MKEMHFEVEICANKNVVWRTLWDEAMFRVHFDVPSELEEVFANGVTRKHSRG